jgi:hypothetical protein
MLHHLKDWRLYFWAINMCAATLPAFAYSYFLPDILRNGMGFSVAASQLLVAPPQVLGAGVCYISAFISDKYRIRGPIIALYQLLIAAGMLITAFGGSNPVRYFGAFLGNFLS